MIKTVMIAAAVAVTAVLVVPRNQRETSAMLIRSGMQLIELGLFFAPSKRPVLQLDGWEPDPSLEDAIGKRSPEAESKCASV